MRKLLWAAIAATMLAGAAAAAERAADEQAVWKLEEDYWRYVQAGNLESYVELWHEDFVGWPCHSKTPSDKSGIGTWVQDIRDNRWIFDYTLRPLAFRSFDDVVVVHYAAEYVYENSCTSGRRPAIAGRSSRACARPRSP